MNLLALDTAGAACAVAVRSSGAIVAFESEEMDRGQAEELTPMIGRVMAAAGMKFTDLDHIAVTVGPGSFTGLRIGLAAARGLGLAASVPVGGVSSFDVAAKIAQNAQPGLGPLGVILETKRADYYTRFYDQTGASLDGGAALDVDRLAVRLDQVAPEGAAIVLAGDAALRAVDALAGRTDRSLRVASALSSPAIETMSALSEQIITDGGALLPPDPVYMRPPDVRLPVQ